MLLFQVRNFSQVSPEFGRRLTEALAKFQTVDICNRLNPYEELIFIAWMNILFLLWFMAESASGQSEANPVFWLVTVYLSGQDKLYKQRRFWATHVNRKWTLFLSGIFAQSFGQIVPIIGKRPRKTYLVLSIYFKMKKMSFPVDVRCSKTSLLDLPNDQARSVKMTGFWLRSFLLKYCPRPHGP